MQGARVGAALLVCGAVAAGAAAATAESLVGTKGGNLLVGTKRADTLIGKAGGDLLRGKAGDDRLSGGRGRDGVIGGLGLDRIRGGPGNDVITAADGRADRFVDGGRGANSCVIDIPADLGVTRNCGTILAGSVPRPGAGGGDGGGGDPGGQLTVTSAQGLVCAQVVDCAFTITGNGADALVGNVTAGGDVSSAANTAVNSFVTRTWLATGVFSCSAPGGIGWLVVTIGSKSTPRITVNC